MTGQWDQTDHLVGVAGNINSGTMPSSITKTRAAHFYNGQTNDDDYVIYAQGNKSYFSGKIGIGITNPASPLAIANLPTAGGVYNLQIDGSGNVIRGSSSSVRYKENIHDLKADFNKILLLEPKSFIYKNTNTEDIGYIAEELDRLGLEELVIYDAEKKPDGIRYDKISLYLLEVIKSLKKELDEHIKEEKKDVQ